jgi:hypothetical protein
MFKTSLSWNEEKSRVEDLDQSNSIWIDQLRLDGSNLSRQGIVRSQIRIDQK